MSQWEEREQRLRSAIETISAAATGKYFKTRRAGDRATPRVPYNVFFFGRYGEPPRGFVKGYWLYIEAPEAILPHGVELLGKHQYGAFTARLQLIRDDIDVVLPRTLLALKKATPAP